MVDKNSLYGIYDVWHVPFWQTRFFYTILAIVGVFIFVIVLLLVVRRYYARACQRKVSPWDKALAALERLKREEYSTTERGKLVYFTITIVLKEYLHNRYRFDVQGKTDDELLTYLQEQNFEQNLLRYLQDILDGGVMVKFANVQAMQDEILRHLDVASLIVKKIIPKEQ